MSNIIPFESGKLPAYMKAAAVEGLNSDLTAHAGTGFPVISIKGKAFSIVRDGERHVLTKEIDGEQVPAPSIDVVLVKANKANSKVFYLKGFQEGAENQKPDCFSNDGVKPDSSVSAPQAKSCATCKHNQWGSRIGENGGKGKSCQDSVRMAVAQVGQINDPYLLRVPPASIKPLGEYGKMLEKRGVGYNMVVTRIGFVMEEATPKLTFKATGFLDEASYRSVMEVAQEEVVQAILGSSPVIEDDSADPPVPSEDDIPGVPPTGKPAPQAKDPEPEEKPAKTPKAAKAAPADADVEIPDLDLSNINFDD